MQINKETCLVFLPSILIPFRCTLVAVIAITQPQQSIGDVNRGADRHRQDLIRIGERVGVTATAFADGQVQVSQVLPVSASGDLVLSRFPQRDQHHRRSDG